MSEKENVELFRRVTLGVFADGDLSVIDECLTDDFVEHEPAPGVRPGREGVKDIATMIRTGFPDLRITIDDAFGVGDQVSARSTWKGTNTGSFMGMPATGRPATWEAIDIIHVRNGRINEHWGQMDIMGLFTQLGLMQMPMAA
ncbi:MAG TPA: ester cyclase [Thermoleophilia bacterium]|nr:ester cyclase [Thermoleophilia bacterium]